MFEDRLIQKILDAWIEKRNSARRQRITVAIPRYELIKNLVETAYLASIKTEEGRPLRFALVLADPDTSGYTGNIPVSVLRFGSPLQFSVESIVKLAPAFDPRISAIAVGLQKSGDQLMIWGIFTFISQAHRFNEVPVAFSDTFANPPDAFTLYIKEPGSLLIASFTDQIGWIIDGEFHVAAPTPFNSHSLGGFIIKRLFNQDLYKEYQGIYWQVYRDALSLLLSEASARGHGSTIILCDETQLQRRQGLFHPTYRFSEKIGLSRLFSYECSRDVEDIALGIKIRQVIHEKIQLLAQLAAIDGALILTTEMEPVAFGSKLNAERWAGLLVTGPDGWGQGAGSACDMNHKGTRHTSAVGFTGACEGSFAFVISQDGPVRAFHKVEEQILCWLDCNVSMFI